MLGPTVQQKCSGNMALKRFNNLERRLNRNPQLRATYIDFMAQYEKLGHMCIERYSSRTIFKSQSSSGQDGW